MDISFHYKDLYIKSEHRHLINIFLNRYHAHYWTGDHTEKAVPQQALIAIRLLLFIELKAKREMELFLPAAVEQGPTSLFLLVLEEVRQDVQMFPT